MNPAMHPDRTDRSHSSDSDDCEVLIVGAGPYGLASGAHLKSRGIDVRVFGRPMDFWANKMPAGMLLRSPRPASNIADPGNAFTLDDFEASRGIPSRAPVPLETFVEYGRWFQQQLLPELDQREVARIDAADGGFVSTLDDGSRIRSRRVVIAAGIAPFMRIPEEFTSLPGDLLTHCYSGFDVGGFSGRKVTVIGAGQSALESAALLHESGADVELIAAIKELRWIGMHPRLHKLGPISSMLYSKHDVGPAGISRLVAAPNLVRRIPMPARDRIRTRAVRPAGSNWLPARLREVTIRTGRMVRQVRSVGSQAHLTLDDGTVSRTDHVLLGTGYSVDIARFDFLPPQLLQRVKMLGGYPVLRSGFQSSVAGLHFVGATAARTFGPLLYFVTGSEFASQELLRNVLRYRKLQ
jgi:thioredoxin reductase